MREYDRGPRSTGDRSIPARTVDARRRDAEAVSRPRAGGSAAAASERPLARSAQKVATRAAREPMAKFRRVRNVILTLDDGTGAATDEEIVEWGFEEIAEWEGDFPLTPVAKPASEIHRVPVRGASPDFSTNQVHRGCESAKGLVATKA